MRQPTAAHKRKPTATDPHKAGVGSSSLRTAETFMDLPTPYDGVPKNPVKRTAKRILALAANTLRAVPGYDRAVRAVDTITGADGFGWQRHVMYQEAKRLVDQLGPEKLDALEISGNRWGSLVKFKSFKWVDFPEYDLCVARSPSSSISS